MRPSLTFTTLVASGAVIAGVLAAPAHADENAQTTITQLQQQGYTVNVDRVGSGRIQDCVVTGVRNPQTQTEWIKDYYGPRDENGDRRFRLIEIVTNQTISVSLDCT